MNALRMLLVLLLLSGCSDHIPEAHPVTLRYIIWLTGQSNSWGIHAGGPGNQTLAAVQYWDSLLSTDMSTSFHNLTDIHGKDWTIGKRLSDAGVTCDIINVSKGSTYSNQWISPHPYYTDYVNEATAAFSALQTLRAGDTFKHVHIRDIGEEDIRYPTSGIPSLWAENNRQTHAALETIVGASVERFVMRTNLNMDGANWPAIIAQEALDFAGGSSRVINRNQGETAVTYDVGGLHMNTAGYITAGNIAADALLLWMQPVPTPAAPKRPPQSVGNIRPVTGVGRR